jgi:hypothetical protein
MNTLHRSAIFAPGFRSQGDRANEQPHELRARRSAAS